jgi:hypothetical protein
MRHYLHRCSSVVILVMNFVELAIAGPRARYLVKSKPSDSISNRSTLSSGRQVCHPERTCLPVGRVEGGSPLWSGQYGGIVIYVLVAISIFIIMLFSFLLLTQKKRNKEKGALSKEFFQFTY